MTRKPPSTVRQLLRREVGFVCPVEGCSSPYLSYHHFDPPWAQRPHHNQKGMIALCLQHHKAADAGAFTNDQLKKLKNTSSTKLIQGRFHWKRDQLFIIAGSNFFLGSPSILEYGNKKLIWFGKSSDGYATVNMDLFSPSGQLVFSMRKNDWVVFPKVEDIDSPPSARSLVVRSKRNAVSLDLQFYEGSLDQVCARARQILKKTNLQAEKQLPWPDIEIKGVTFPPREDPVDKSVTRLREFLLEKLVSESICTCELNLEIEYPVPLKLSPTKLTMNLGQSLMHFSGCLMGNVSVLKLTDNSSGPAPK